MQRYVHAEIDRRGKVIRHAEIDRRGKVIRHAEITVE